MLSTRRKYLIYVVIVALIIVIKVKLDSWATVDPIDRDGYDASSQHLRENRLLNLSRFKYLLQPDVCAGRKDPLLGVIIVTSYVGHDDVRAEHRKGISQAELRQMGLDRVFLLARIPPSERFITQNSVRSEQKKFKDLLQGDFIENYRNLTYKHVMGIRWAATRCAHAKLIVKIDDDSVYDIYRVHKYLKELEHQRTRQFLAGYVFDRQTPIRLEADKHFVTEEEYPGAVYPKYLSGWLYITTPSTVRLLLQATERRPFFWIDDTYVTGILAEDQPEIEFVDLTHWFSANPDFFDCCLRDMKRHRLQCEFAVGPNGGDTKLLTLFQQETRKCLENNDCRKRQGPREDIRQTCVTEYKDLLRSNHGHAVVRPMKL